MAVEIPVVSFAVGGIGEYLLHNHNGWVVNDPSPKVCDSDTTHLCVKTRSIKLHLSNTEVL